MIDIALYMKKKTQQKFWTMISGYQQIYTVIVTSKFGILNSNTEWKSKKPTNYITFCSLGVLSSLYLSRDIQHYTGEFMSSHYFPVSV